MFEQNWERRKGDYSSIVPIEVKGWKGKQLYYEKGNKIHKNKLLENVNKWSVKRMEETYGKANLIREAGLQLYEGIHIYDKMGGRKTIVFKKSTKAEYEKHKKRYLEGKGSWRKSKPKPKSMFGIKLPEVKW